MLISFCALVGNLIPKLVSSLIVHFPFYQSQTQSALPVLVKNGNLIVFYWIDLKWTSASKPLLIFNHVEAWMFRSNSSGHTSAREAKFLIFSVAFFNQVLLTSRETFCRLIICISPVLVKNCFSVPPLSILCKRLPLLKVRL